MAGHLNPRCATPPFLLYFFVFFFLQNSFDRFRCTIVWALYRGCVRLAKQHGLVRSIFFVESTHARRVNLLLAFPRCICAFLVDTRRDVDLVHVRVIFFLGIEDVHRKPAFSQLLFFAHKMLNNCQ